MVVSLLGLCLRFDRLLVVGVKIARPSDVSDDRVHVFIRDTRNAVLQPISEQLRDAALDIIHDLIATLLARKIVLKRVDVLL